MTGSMKTNLNKLAMVGLHVSLGLIILVEAALLALAPVQIRAFAHTGLPDWVRIVLAWSELLSALLFLIPRTMIVGGWGLLLAFLFAAALHLLHGRMDLGALVIYSAAVLVVMTREANQS